MEAAAGGFYGNDVAESQPDTSLQQQPSKSRCLVLVIQQLASIMKLLRSFFTMIFQQRRHRHFSSISHETQEYATVAKPTKMIGMQHYNTCNLC